jgi:hypothetical protein
MKHIVIGLLFVALMFGVGTWARVMPAPINTQATPPGGTASAPGGCVGCHVIYLPVVAR